MGIFKDGRQMALAVAAIKVGEKNAKKMETCVEKGFKNTFSGGKFPTNLKTYDQLSFELLRSCNEEISRSKILKDIKLQYGAEPLLLNFFNYLVNQTYTEERKDTSAGQAPNIYIASSSQVNNTRFFGPRIFGCTLEVNNDRENCNIRPGVPFRYADGHGMPLQAAIFMQAYIPDNKKGLDFDGRVKAAYGIYLEFAKDMQRTHYYGDSQFSLEGTGINSDFQNVKIRTHVHSPTEHSGDHSRRHIPLIPCVYDGSSGIVKLILSLEKTNLDGSKSRVYNTDMSVREFIEHTGLDSQPDFADFRDVLLAMEGNLFYPKIVMHDHSLKESLCVDMRRTKRIYDYTRTIKEIGSDMSPKQMKHMIASPFTDGNVVEGHTGCGYNNTVMAAYLAFKELGEKTSGNPKLLMNKLARAILKRIDDGERGPLDQRQFKDALNELRMAGIHFETKVDKTGNETKPAEDFLRALICGGADDTRETIGQALGGGNTEKAIAKIDERGYLVMPAMQAVEEIALELLPNGVELHAEHFDYLVTEEVTRRIIERYHDLAEKIGRESPLELNGRMADLHTNFAFVLAEHLPHSIDELFDMRRTRYYKPDKREAPGIDLNTSPYMSIEELHRFEKQKRRSA